MTAIVVGFVLATPVFYAVRLVLRPSGGEVVNGFRFVAAEIVARTVAGALAFGRPRRPPQPFPWEPLPGSSWASFSACGAPAAKT